MRLVATGASNQQIAQRLNISANTVKVHLRNIFMKIGVVSRTEATVYAIRHGLVAVASGMAVEPEDTGTQIEIMPVAAMPPDPELFVASAAVSGKIAATSAPAIPSTLEADLPPTLPAVPAPSPRRPPLLLIGVGISIALVILIALEGQLVTQRPMPTTGLVTTVPTVSGMNQAQRWLTHASLPTPRDGFALTAYDLEHKLYVIGGRVGRTVSAAVERYDPVSDRWITLADKPTAVSDVSAVVLHGRIYIPGGEDASGHVRNILEIYDPRNQRWDAGAALPKPRSRYALVVWEGQLYLIGGWDGTAIRGNVYIYDPETNTWAEGPPLPSPRQNAGATTASGRIYVIGGSDSSGALSKNVRLDPTETDMRWGVIAPLPAPVMLPGVVAPLGTILIFDRERRFSFRYDPNADAWEEFAIPDEAIVASHVTLLGSNIYLLNGTSPPGPGAMSEYQAVFTVFLPSR